MSGKKGKKYAGLKSGAVNAFLATAFVVLGLVAIFSELDSTAGYYVYRVLFFLFGEYYNFIFSPVALALGTLAFLKEGFFFNKKVFFGLALYLTSISTIVGFVDNSYSSIFNLDSVFLSFFGAKASIVFLALIFLFSLFLMFEISYRVVFKKLVLHAKNLKFARKDAGSSDKSIDGKNLNTSKTKKEALKSKEEEDNLKDEFLKAKKALQEMKYTSLEDTPRKITITKKESSLSSRFKLKDAFLSNGHKEPKTFKEPRYDRWVLPNIELLSDIGGDFTVNEEDIYSKQKEIIDKLKQFKIDVKMTGYRVGPAVIQFRLKPKEGIKLNKIENLKKDLALALHAKSIRIQAPIPGEGVVGIEVPNAERQLVGLKEIIASKEFRNQKLEIPIAIGKDVNGDIVVGDLTKMPHLLVAGQTASGKSVGMNGFIISMLYKFSPSELKMIMIDPKRVELSVYNGIPHLLAPVVTSPDKALNSLRWAIGEMLRRYDLATEVNARNFKEYNEKVEREKRLPYIVIIIDELADLMMSGNKKEVENSIARIAQMARAVGIHLIVATQRPSVNVITGLIKANIPSRIAYTVASQVDSRTIIDRAGAEDLLGKGDMLYLPTGMLEPQRVQGVLVQTNEVEAVVNRLKLTVDPDMIKNMYDYSIINGKPSVAGGILEKYKGDQKEEPEIIEKAIKIVRESKKGSTSLIQRKLGLGYARAAKILDILEELGVVGPANGSKPREVYE